MNLNIHIKMDITLDKQTAVIGIIYYASKKHWLAKANPLKD